MPFLLDTNVCVDFARGRSLRLLERMEACQAGDLAMSAISYAELAVGARSSGDARDVARLTALVRIVEPKPFDRAAGERYGALVRLIGMTRNSFDRLIAAHALALGVTLVVSNERDFADIPDLKVENWTLPA